MTRVEKTLAVLPDSCSNSTPSHDTCQTQRIIDMIMIWATSWENLFMPYANNKGADQPAHLRSLISAFIVRCLDSIIPVVSISKIANLYLASLAVQGRFESTLVANPEDRFSRDEAHFIKPQEESNSPENSTFFHIRVALNIRIFKMVVRWGLKFPPWEQLFSITRLFAKLNCHEIFVLPWKLMRHAR